MLYCSDSADDSELPELPTNDVGVTAVPEADLAGEQKRRLDDLRAGFVAQTHRTRRGSSPAAAAQVTAYGERDTDAELELRSVVPFLSPAFTCSFHDASLLLSAIHNGGATTAAGGKTSLADRVSVLESERNALANKLARREEECEDLKTKLADVRDRMKAAQEDHRRAAAIASQKLEEGRRQLIMEEGRTQKLQIKLKKAEAEMDSLKARFRTHQ